MTNFHSIYTGKECLNLHYTCDVCLPANARRCPTVGSELVQRLRRWPNIKPAVGERLALAVWCQ